MYLTIYNKRLTMSIGFINFFIIVTHYWFIVVP